MATRARPGYDDLPRLMSRMTGDEKHGPSATSTLDVLRVLYDRLLRIDPDRPTDPLRDRFLLSKGHGPMAYYAVLAAAGFFPEELLDSFGSYDSPLGWHPDRKLVPGVEIGSGSLGHGLPIAVGVALALRAKGNATSRVVVLIGDAELDEGSNHEASATAARLGVGALSAVVIDNGSASHGWPGGIASRFTVEGWSAMTVDGRDHDAIEQAFRAAPGDRPHAVVARVEAKE
jgi:transketolase